MDFSFTDEQERIREAIAKLCARFGDDYWLQRDTDAAVMMQAIAESGAGFSGASAVHMNIFGLNPVVVFGTQEQKERMLRPLIAGKERACFAVTEPDTGLNTRNLKVKAEKKGNKY